MSLLYPVEKRAVCSLKIPLSLDELLAVYRRACSSNWCWEKRRGLEGDYLFGKMRPLVHIRIYPKGPGKFELHHIELRGRR